MSPRRIHELFRDRCPSVDFAKCDWENVLSNEHVDEDLLMAMLSTLDTDDVLTYVNRAAGASLGLTGAAEFVREHLGKNNIYVARRDFARLVIVAQNGVATVWPSS